MERWTMDILIMSTVEMFRIDIRETHASALIWRKMHAYIHEY